MSIKTVAVIADNTSAGKARIQYASQLAVAHGAFLIGLLPVSGGAFHSPASSFALGHAANASVIHSQMEREQKLVEETRDTFEAATKQVSVPGELRVVRTDIDEGGVVLASLHADLVVAPLQPTHPAGEGRSPDVVQLLTGVPFLLLPTVWNSSQAPRHALVGWNTSREARRAVQDALPLLLMADSVTVAIVDPQQNLAEGKEPGADLALYLVRHGVKLTVQPLQSHGAPVSEALLEYAQKNGHDLIVIGAYSHSRTVERVFGGVTRSLLEQSPIPLLISH